MISIITAVSISQYGIKSSEHGPYGRPSVKTEFLVPFISLAGGRVSKSREIRPSRRMTCRSLTPGRNGTGGGRGGVFPAVFEKKLVLFSLFVIF